VTIETSADDGTPPAHLGRIDRDAGRASLTSLAREGLASARAQPVASGVAALILAVVCAVVFTTTGQSAASEARVISQVEATGSRTLVFSDPSGSADLRADRLDAIAQLAGVDWILALGPPEDTTNIALDQAGQPIATRAVYTALPPSIELAGGREPRAGEAILGATAATTGGFQEPIGALARDQRVIPVVGGFEAASPLTNLGAVALVRGNPHERAPMQTLIVVARDVQDVALLSDTIPGLLDSGDPTQLQISSPAILAELQRVLAGEVGSNTRRLMLLVLATGLMLVAITQYGTMVARRRDFGRRRALGASRSDLMLVILAQVLSCAVVGVVVGTAVGLVLVRTLSGTLPNPTFVLGVVALVTLSSVAAAVPPAVAAARVDPVRILRVP
jgi:putative ABC transport system permease protein